MPATLTRVIAYIFVISFTGNVVAQAVAGSGSTLEFNGVNQYVGFNSSFGSLQFPMTLMLWYKHGGGNQAQYTFFCSHSRSGVYRGVLFRYIAGKLNVEFGNGRSRSPAGRWGYVSPQTFASGRWYHLAVIMNSPGDVQFYIDGNKVSTNFVPSSSSYQNLVTNNSIGRIGANVGDPNTHYIQGELDEFSFWETALSEQEMRGFMCAKIIGNEPGLVVSYSFDEGGGNQLTNRLSGGPGATLIGGPAWKPSSAPVGDRSSYSHNASEPVEVRSLSGDSIVVRPASSATPGTHLYIVDTLPLSLTGVDVPPSEDYYFGVFNANNHRQYDVEVKPNPASGALRPNSWYLAERPHNASQVWEPTAPTNNPNIVLSGQDTVRQYIVSQFPCFDFDFNLGKDTLICPGNTVKVGRESSTGETYRWSTGASSDSIVLSAVGTYWLEVTVDSTGCSETDSITITEVETLPLDLLLINDTSLCEDSDRYLFLDYPNLSFRWPDSSVGRGNTISQSDTVILEVLRPCDTSLFSIYVDIVDCECKAEIPNVFTPNGDQVNEEFRIDVSCEPAEYDLQVFNRWGRLVFESSSAGDSWDGTINGKVAAPGVYYYVLRYQSTTSGVEEESGFVTLVR